MRDPAEYARRLADLRRMVAEDADGEALETMRTALSGLAVDLDRSGLCRVRDQRALPPVPSQATVAHDRRWYRLVEGEVGDLRVGDVLLRQGCAPAEVVGRDLGRVLVLRLRLADGMVAPLVCDQADPVLYLRPDDQIERAMARADASIRQAIARALWGEQATAYGGSWRVLLDAAATLAAEARAGRAS